MLTVSIILIIVSIMLTIYSVISLRKTHQLNTTIDIENDKLQKTNSQLRESSIKLQEELSRQSSELNNKKEQLNDLQNNITKTINNQEELSKRAFENYCQILEKNYEEKEEEYDLYENALQTAYSNLQLQLIKEIDKIKADLAQIEATRAAAIQAKIKEKEIKDKLSFYCLKISDNDLSDIKILERIKPQLNQPRILSMLIWKTYFQKPMTNLCNNIIGTSTKCGIYKITNQKDDMCYIGQSVDLATRWKDHAKCGLGIDTPPANKLYQSMIEDGLWNFSFEILEECPREQLDEKEKYYINLYQSKSYGFNSTAGNK